MLLVEHSLDKETEAEEIVKREQDVIVLMSKFSPVPYGKKLLKTNFFLYDDFKRFWRYNKAEGIWKEDGDIFIRNMLRKTFDKDMILISNRPLIHTDQFVFLFQRILQETYRSSNNLYTPRLS